MDQRPEAERRGRLFPGQMVGQYRIEYAVGEGAMGEVYRAWDTHLDRTAAIKVLRPESVANPDRRKRFVQEAKTASALNHPNIITIYDINTAAPAGEPVEYIAMEYVDGKTLNALIAPHGRSQPMPWEDALKSAIQVAGALAAAHAAGLVHRDLKPANVMVTQQGLVKVLDFGLAKLVDPADSEAGSPLDGQPGAPTETVDAHGTPKTEEGAIVGTVAYMSPEQAQGRPLDARSDIFSFGSLLYEMLTGRCPFRGPSRIAILGAVVHAEPQPPRELAADIPPQVERIVLKCLRKDPARRFQSMADLKLALQELKEESDSGRFASTVSIERPAGWMTGRRAAAALVIVFAALAVWLFWDRIGNSILPPERVVAVLPCQSGGDAADQVFCDGIAETLSSKLAQLQQFHKSLQVIAANEVRAAAVNNALEARQAFNASLVVTIGVQRSSGEVKVTANVVNARTMRRIASDSVRTRVGELAGLEASVVDSVVQMLRLELGKNARAALANGATGIPGAYEFYVQGCGYLLRHDRPENVDSAIEVFQRALGADPNYALAHAGLGEAYWYKHRMTRDAQWVEPAQNACRRAVEINDRLAPVRVTLAMVLRGSGRPQEAIEELQEALRIDPMSADAHRELAGAYEDMGRIEEAEDTFKKSIQLRPDYWAGYKDLGGFYYRRARYGDAERQFRFVVDLTPDNARAWSSLGGVYFLMGRHAEAARMFEKSISIKPTADAYSNLGTMYHYQARYSEAVPMMEKAIELGKTDYLSWGNLAEAYRRAPGYEAKAPDAYRKAVELAGKQLTVNPHNAAVRASLASYCAKLGDHQRALVEIDEARRLAPRNVNVLFRSALVYELTGQRERALAGLAEAIDHGYSLEEVRRAADLEDLRKDPRFQQLLDGRLPQ